MQKQIDLATCSDKERTDHWTNKYAKHLLNQKIVKVQYLSNAEAKDFGWDQRPICIQLENGTWLTPLQDDEMNNGGSMMTNVECGTIPVLGVE